MSIFSELKRRQVFGVVALYAVASWAVIEVGDMAIDSGIVSGLTTGNLFTLALIGFPLVLVAGWFYDVTRKGMFRTAPAKADDFFEASLGTRDYLLLVALMAIWAGVYFYTHIPPAVEKSIAVMPFENRGNDPENAHFAFGIHDDLMTQLQRIGDLKLIAASSVSKIDPDTSVQMTGLRLGAAFIMKGTVERVLDRIRVNVVLVEAAEAQQAWAGSFDRELSATNLFEIRDEITMSITDNLQAVLSPEEKSRVFDLPTVSLEANIHYMRGRQLMPNRDTNRLLQAVREFEAAVEIDPEFALAWVGIADANLLLSFTGAIGWEEERETRFRAAEKALALNDQLGEAQVAYGDSLRYRGMREEATTAYVKAIELAPNYALAYHRYAIHLSGLENTEQRLALYQKAIQLDPMTPTYQLNLTAALRNLGREEEAMQQLMRLLELSPEFHGSYFGIAEAYFGKGQIAEAIDWNQQAVQLDPVNAFLLEALAIRYLSLEAYDEVARVRQWMAERLNSGDWRLGNLDYLVLRRQQNLQGALDYLESLPDPWTTLDYVLGQTGYLHYLMSDLHKAREFWSKQEGWPNTLGMDGQCYDIHVLMATGDEALGREQLDQALRYFEVTLPSLIRHTHRAEKQGICYLLDGKPDKALDFYKQRIGHGHFTDWWEIRLINLWDPVRDDPRFSALDQRVDELITEQRKLLRQMEEQEPDSVPIQ